MQANGMEFKASVSETFQPKYCTWESSWKRGYFNTHPNGKGSSFRQVVCFLIDPTCQWRQTGGCDPNGGREESGNKPCFANIPADASGFCDCNGNNAKDGWEPGYDCSSGPGTCDEACPAPPTQGPTPEGQTPPPPTLAPTPQPTPAPPTPRPTPAGEHCPHVSCEYEDGKITLTDCDPKCQFPSCDGYKKCLEAAKTCIKSREDCWNDGFSLAAESPTGLEAELEEPKLGTSGCIAAGVGVVMVLVFFGMVRKSRSKRSPLQESMLP